MLYKDLAQKLVGHPVDTGIGASGHQCWRGSFNAGALRVAKYSRRELLRSPWLYPKDQIDTMSLSEVEDIRSRQSGLHDAAAELQMSVLRLT